MAAESKSLPIQSKDDAANTTNTTKTSQEAAATNPRGIPSFPFLPNVTDYIKSTTETESVLTRFQEMISKYQFMQSNVERRAAGLREKLPEMKRTLDVVRFLRRKKKATKSLSTTSSEPLADNNELDGADEEENEDADDDNASSLQTTFQLQDTLYAHASIDTSNLESVYLWLGANVMVSYPLDEAETLLASKLDKAKASLKAAEEDLEFLRVQVTTLEVATARVHNWDVAEKRKLKLQQGSSSSASGRDVNDDGGGEDVDGNKKD